MTAYCGRAGAPPHELISLWSPSGPTQTPEERAASYQNAVTNVFQLRPALKKSPDGLATHLFALAVTFDQRDEIRRRYSEREDLRTFENACSFARVVAPTDPEAAWSALSSKLAGWMPVDAAQVAPVVLLVDPAMAPLITAERAEQVLRTPRASD